MKQTTFLFLCNVILVIAMITAYGMTYQSAQESTQHLTAWGYIAAISVTTLAYLCCIVYPKKIYDKETEPYRSLLVCWTLCLCVALSGLSMHQKFETGLTIFITTLLIMALLHDIVHVVGEIFMSEA